MRPLFWGIGAGAVVVIGLCAMLYDGGAQAQALPYKDPVRVAEGKEIYLEACAACRGNNLEGQPNWRDRGADGKLPAPPHDMDSHTWHHPEGQLFAITKYGTEAMVGGDYKSDMRAFEGELSDAQIMDVLAYIKSTWPADIRERHSAMSQ